MQSATVIDSIVTIGLPGEAVIVGRRHWAGTELSAQPFGVHQASAWVGACGVRAC